MSKAKEKEHIDLLKQIAKKMDLIGINEKTDFDFYSSEDAYFVYYDKIYL